MDTPNVHLIPERMHQGSTAFNGVGNLCLLRSIVSMVSTRASKPLGPGSSPGRSARKEK